MLLLGVVISAFLLWLAVRNVEWAEVGSVFAAARPLYVMPLLVALFAYYWLKASRWSLLLRPLGRFRTPALFPPVLIGYAASNVLPMQMGELLRTAIASRRSGLSAASLVTSIALERVLDMAAIGVLVAGTLLFVPTDDALRSAGALIAALVASGLVLAVIAVTARERALSIASAVIPERLRERCLPLVASAIDGLSSIRDPWLLGRALANSLLQWACMAASAWMSLIAVGIDVTWGMPFVVIVFTAVGLMMPTAPGYVGSIQLAFVLALKPFGVAESAALAASIFWHATAYVSVLAAGALLFAAEGLDIGLLRRAVRKEAA